MGTSLLTNQSAMNALQTLRAIGNNLDTTQRRVSTGLRINEAADDTAYWSISSMMKSDRNALSAVSSAMDLGKSQIEIAYQSTVKTKEYLDKIEKTLTTVYEKGPGDVEKIQRDVKASLANIKDAIYSAALAEKNILANGGQTVNVAGAYRREGTAVYVDMIQVGGPELNFATPKADAPGTFDLTQGVLKDIFAPSTATDLSKKVKDLNDAVKTLADSPLDHNNDDYKKLVTAVENAAKKFTVQDFVDISTASGDTNVASIKPVGLEYLAKALQQKVTKATSDTVTAGASLGASKGQIENQIDYVSKLMDAIDKGVGALVDADMNAESARLASLQVQQQLGIQALSIANQNSQNILALFRQ